MRTTRATQSTSGAIARPDGITRAGIPFPSRRQRQRESAGASQASEGNAGPIGPRDGAPRAPAGREDLGGTPKASHSVRRPPTGRRIGDPAEQVDVVTPKPKAESKSEKKPQRNPKQKHYSERFEMLVSKPQMEKLDELRAGFEELTGSKMSRAAYMRALLEDSTATMERALVTAAAMGGPGDDTALVAATEQLSAVTNQVRLLGINANQIAKIAHQDTSDRDRLAEVLEDISIDLDEVKEQLDLISGQLQQAGYGGLRGDDA